MMMMMMTMMMTMMRTTGMTMLTVLRRMVEVLVAETVPKSYVTGPLQSSMNAYKEMDKRQTASELPPMKVCCIIQIS